MKLNLLNEEEVRLIVAQEIALLEARMLTALSKLPRQEVKSNLCESDPIDALMLSDRVKYIFDRAGIKTVGQLTSLTEGQLIRYRCFGKKSFHEVKAKLASFGLKLSKPDFHPCKTNANS